MRRIFRRSMRKNMRADVPPILQEANKLFDKGEYDKAAALYEQMATAAEGRDGPRAPFFFLQAGRAHVLAGRGAVAYDICKRGLGLLARREQFPRLHQAGNRIVANFQERGMTKEAEEMSAWLKSVLPPRPASGFEHAAPPPSSSKKIPALPTHCPSCGAPVRSDEVEWIDQATAECNFCGSPVRGE